MKKAIIIINSKNKKNVFANHLFDVGMVLSKQDYDIHLYYTKEKKDVYNHLMKVKDTYQLVVLAGGDGTMNEACNAISTFKKKPKIMFFPTGTVNDFATSLKLNGNFKRNLKILRNHESRPIDSGRVNDQYFNYICAFGPFTKTSYMTPHNEKRKYGKFAYLKRVFEDIPHLSRSYHLKINVDGKKFSGDFVYAMIVNSNSVAGFRYLFRDDKLDDGYFNLVLVSKANHVAFRNMLQHMIKGNTQQFEDGVYIYHKFKKLSIKTDSPIVWTIDGERGPTGSVDIEVIKHNLNIITP
jgi:diacylglycerol kinase (ATP)